MSAAPPHRDLATGLRHAFKNYGLEPRPHQVRTVAKIIMDVASYQFSHDHEIRNYLIQHTAGSGKSLTIAALILCLSKLKVRSQLFPSIFCSAPRLGAGLITFL